MPGETRAPRALLLTCTDAHRDRTRAVLRARGWEVLAAHSADATLLEERPQFALAVVEYPDHGALDHVHELCRAASHGCSHLLVITGRSQLEAAAALVAPRAGDVLMAPFDEAQLHARIAVAEARLDLRNHSGENASELSTLEKTLRYQSASLEELFQNAPEGIAIVDADDHIIRVNAEFTRMFGYSAEESIGRLINDLIAPDHLLDEARALSKGVRTKKHLVEETLRRRRDGTLLDVSVLATPITLGDGLDGAFAIYRDISEQKAQERALQASEARFRTLFDEAERVNAELLERTREIETAMAAKNRLYSALNHELRTPISAVMLYQELLLAGSMGELLPDQHDALERSHTAARHLLEVVRDVLDLSRMEAGGSSARMVEVELAPLLRELAMTAEPLAQLHGSRIQVVIRDDLGTIVTDPQKLRQIILNLLSNAAKFGRSAPIELICTTLRDSIALEVRDRGIGIDEADQALIFEDFVQVEEGRGGGTGLGLPISRRLAGLLGGRLEVESELGAGSTFRLILPLETPLATSQEEVVPG